MDTEKIAIDFLEKHNLEIKCITDESIGYLALFDSQENTIKLCNFKLIEEYYLYNDLMDFEDYIILILCHELGHAFDPNLQQLNKDLMENKSLGREEKKKIKKTKENNAWKYGLKFVPNHLVKLYDFMNKSNLNTIEETQLRYDLLLKYNEKEIKLLEKIGELQKSVREYKTLNNKLIRENTTLSLKKDIH